MGSYTYGRGKIEGFCRRQQGNHIKTNKLTINLAKQVISEMCKEAS